MSLPSEEALRLKRIFDNLRQRLLDLTRRNQLLNYGLSPRSKRFLQAVDSDIEGVHRRLVSDEQSIEILPLPEPDSIPADERTDEFRVALERAKATDIKYLTALEALGAAGQIGEADFEKLDRELRDRLRTQLGLPIRANIKEISRTDHARSLGINPDISLTSRKNGRAQETIQTLKFPTELKALLEKISGDARLAEQEMGLSTLFLAFGFLEWYESDSSEKKSFAPLLLLPVQIELKQTRGVPTYSLSLREGDVEANLSLRKLLERDHARILPDFQEVDDDVSIPSIEGYFKRVQSAIEGLKRWKIHRWVVLGHFSFGRFAMYADLDSQKWGAPEKSFLVQSILRGTDQKEDSNLLSTVAEDYYIDDPQVESIAPYLIQDADASQHSALIDVMKGENLVIQGPPGTGKSQTITNIIANALAQKKTVLFLAEKLAALEVVKRRLDHAGIGDFCLELHSDKIAPKSVVSSLRGRYNASALSSSARAPKTLDDSWLQSRDQVTSYVNALNETSQDGESAYSLMWQAIRKREQTAAFRLTKLPAELINDQALLGTALVELGTYTEIVESFYKNFGDPFKSPWQQFGLRDFPVFEASSLINALNSLRDAESQFAELISAQLAHGIANHEDLDLVANLFSALPPTPRPELVIAILDSNLDDLTQILPVKARLLELTEALADLGSLRDTDIALLSRAASLHRTRLGITLQELSPALAYSKITTELGQLEQMSRCAEAILPTLASLGMQSVSVGAHLMTGAIAAHKLVEIPVDWRQRTISLWSVSVTEVEAIVENWRALNLAEKSWGQRLKTYGPTSRPSAAKLEEIATTLRKGGLTKLLATISGAMGAARAYCEQIGIDTSPATIEELAKHIRAVNAFESEQGLSEMFGTTWLGVNTPVEEILAALRNAAKIKFSLQGLPGFKEIDSQISRIKTEDIDSYSQHAAGLKQFINLASQVRSEFDNRTIEQCLRSLQSKIDDARQFLAVDPPRVLTNIARPIREIAAAYSASKEFYDYNCKLTASKSNQLVTRLCTNATEITNVGCAIDWIAAVRRSAIPQDLKIALTSAQLELISRDLSIVLRKSNDLKVARLSAIEIIRRYCDGTFLSYSSDEQSQLLQSLCAKSGELSDILTLRKISQQLDKLGLTEFLTVCAHERIQNSEISKLFHALVAERRAENLRRSTGLRDARGAILDSYRQKFATGDTNKILNDRSTIRGKLFQANPPIGSQLGPRRDWTNMRLLQNEFGKSTRFVPVRRLISRAGPAIQALKPCFMMSHLSLAKFIDAGSIHFDLLVIDEASQMRPEDALGGLLRASQIVVVGDAKQLPPTDFFSRSSSGDSVSADEEDSEDDIDAESILETCEVTFGKRRRLKWHYRSRCESLIAFSNHAFYDDSLITFPMAKPGSFSIDLIRVNGLYQARRNPAEAARIAEEAIAFMRHYSAVDESEIPSLGIVAINTEQREFIQEELERMWGDDELVETYRKKVHAKGEPLFVKNLENVQGDERDYVFISLTYGPKKNADLIGQNFGPINRKQGHRRLNVLFSRARMRVALFTSFGSSDVRPTPTSSEGVVSLKKYLEYAETRGRTIAHSIGVDAESDFEDEVARRLRLRGFEVDLQVVVSGYRIDLGVRHPVEKDSFLAGIECDGATFHSSRSARDRDRLRESVLRGLGWNILRVWSTDWFDNPDVETDKLVRKLKELQEAPTSRYEPYLIDNRPSINDSISAVDGLPEYAANEGEEYGPHEAASDAGDVHTKEHVDTAAPMPPIQQSDSPEYLKSLIDSDCALSVDQAERVLEAFRDYVIKPSIPNWVMQRSILRPAMLTNFVSKRIRSRTDWFAQIPQFLRLGTSPEEPARFLDKITEIVDRIDDSFPAELPRRSKPQKTLASTAIQQRDVPQARTEPLTNSTPSTPVIRDERIYRYGDPSSIATPEKSRFHEADYAPVLRKMIAHVVETEGPIFEDELVDRIARAHGLMRSGNLIRSRVMQLLPKPTIRTKEAERYVLWPNGLSAGQLVPYRRDARNERRHENIPVEELASIAQPLVAKGLDNESILRKMTEFFSMDRLRESTRIRFSNALRIARAAKVSAVQVVAC